jgi:hypothetical protein
VNELVWTADGAALYAHEANYERTTSSWFRYDPATGARREATLFAPMVAAAADAGVSATAGAIRALSFAADGRAGAAVLRDAGQATLWRFDLQTGTTTREASASAIWATAFHPDGTITCVAGPERTLMLDCGGAEISLGDHVYGAIVVDETGMVIFARPDESGTLDLWEAGSGRIPRRLTRFDRDAYAPGLLADGDVVFRVQDYRIFLAMVPAAGGEVTAVTTFQSETPSWNWQGDRLAFTYGSWRRIIDDAHYPDISQHVGIVDLDRPLPAAAPHATVRSS